MRTEEVLSHPCRVLTEAQRQAYFDDGAVLVEGAVRGSWLERLRAASAAAVDAARDLAESDGARILEDGHSTGTPRLKRLTSPVSHHPEFWEFASDSAAADAAADVVGPDVKFHHSKLNYKWGRGGDSFDWHQDIQAWPHTNYSPVTVGVYLEDCGPDMGPLLAVRGSHKGPLHSMYDAERNWVLRIPEETVAAYGADSVLTLAGPAGSMILLNCRTVHGSRRNRSDRARPLLLNVYSAADAFPYTANPIPSAYAGTIVRGRPARQAHHDPRGCEVPPDWSQGYAGPWRYQHQGRAAAG